MKRRYDELTVMSGIAILFVVAIHGCGSALTRFYPAGATYADVGLLVRALNNFVAPAVPMFLFVSGFKYSANDVNTPYLVFLKKRLPRVLMSFAIINTLFWLLDSIIYMESFDIVLLAKTYLASWMGNSVAYQLWYIPMYCCVIIVCPLFRKVIPSTFARFCIYAVVAIVQRVFEVDFPILATYPIRFISYPVFFEMGVLAQEKSWQEKISNVRGVFIGIAYFLVTLIFSWFAPVFVTNGITKFVFFYFVGTASMFAFSVSLRSCRILRWFGVVSYPIFLLHEPLIGRSTTAVLRFINGVPEIVHVVCWISIVLLVSVVLMKIIEKIHLDKLLWNFKLK